MQQEFCATEKTTLKLSYTLLTNYFFYVWINSKEPIYHILQEKLELVTMLFFIAGWYLMLISAISDLNKRIAPRLDAFHSSDGAGKTGVTYWKKTYLDMDYCEAQNGFVCQRPAAAGADPYNKGFFFIEH